MAEAIYATGKRKNAIARVWLSPGEGKIIVNAKVLGDYFGRETLQMMVRQPLELVERIGKINVSANVCGGGFLVRQAQSGTGLQRHLF